MHRTKVKVAEDALDANTTIAQANRADFDRAGVSVVNLMSAPGRRQDHPAGGGAAGTRRRASACSRATCRAASTPTGSRPCTCRSPSSTPTPASAASATSTRTWSARRCRPAARRDRPAGDRERRQPRLPGRVPGRRGRPGDGLLGHRGRGQAAQVPADVPHLRAGGGQQDRPARAPRLRPRQASSTTSTRSIPGSRRCSVSARTGEGIEAFRDWLSGVAGGEAAAGRRWGRDGPAAAARPPDRVGALLRDADRGQPRASSRPRPSAWRALCHRMAERFARGGRLVALGVSPAARSDVRHVTVEFVHPVIVGKRALPAIGLTRDGGPLPAQVDLIAEPDDIAIAFGADEPGGGEVARGARRRPRARLPDDRVRAPRRRVGVRAARAEDPFVRQELAETAYHVLWELVHVFFDHRGLLAGREAGPVHDTGALELPLPVPLGVGDRPRRRGRRTCAPSVLMKAEEVERAARADARRGSRACWSRPPRRCGRCFEAGGKLLALGNGGSATDAMDAVADFRYPPPAAAGRARRGDRPHRGPGDPDRGRATTSASRRSSSAR